MFCPICGNWYDDDKGECACGYVDPEFSGKEDLTIVEPSSVDNIDVPPISFPASEVEKTPEAPKQDQKAETSPVPEQSQAAEAPSVPTDEASDKETEIKAEAEEKYVPGWIKFLKYTTFLNILFNLLTIIFNFHLNLFSIAVIIVNGLLGYFAMAICVDFDEGYDDTDADTSLYYYGYLATSVIFLLIRIFGADTPFVTAEVIKIGFFAVLTVIFKSMIRKNSHLFTKKYERKK